MVNKGMMYLLLYVFSIAASAQTEEISNSSEVFVGVPKSSNDRSLFGYDKLKDSEILRADIAKDISGGPEALRRLYFARLSIDIERSTSTVADRIGLDMDGLEDLYLLLLDIRSEGRALKLEARAEMCRVWGMNKDSLSPMERANAALDAYSAFLSQPGGNPLINASSANLAAALGEENAQKVIDDLNSFSINNRARTFGFTDLVRGVGGELKQMAYSCGE